MGIETINDRFSGSVEILRRENCFFKDILIVRLNIANAAISIIAPKFPCAVKIAATCLYFIYFY